ncbi:hypothetical protein IGI37_003836 [Enterococcus sp. AZ194]|uniref:alpha/beta hydrolase n=1 Tax=Enterococcus sp. AZ194 TaxID=2774629 RepID=UPI003F249B16
MEQQRKKRSLGKKIGMGLLVLLVVVVGSVGIYLKVATYQATDEALEVSQAARDEATYTVYSSGENQSVGLIFYPGALVVPESYSLWAAQVAEAGYDVYVVHFPLNLAVLSPNSAEKIIKKYPDKKFVLAGHSLGGVMASRYAAANPDSIAGMLFLASYPDEKGSLKNTNFPVLSMTATNDGVLNKDNYEQAKQYLPTTTEYLSIEGGNHAGFGSYGAQKGDKESTISNAQQQEKISQAISQWLKMIK